MRVSPSSLVAGASPLFDAVAFLAGVLFAPCPSSAQVLAAELLWEVGAVDGPPETVWAEVSDAVIHEGWIYIADVGSVSVRRYSIDGTFDREIAGRGQGPGEVLYPVTLTSAGSSVLVYDPRQGRVAYFDAKGRHVRTVRPEELPRFLRRLWVLRGGWYAGTTSLVGTLDPSESLDDHYFIWWRSGETPDTLAVIPGAPLWMRVRGSDTTAMVTKHALGPDGDAWVLGDSMMVAVEGSTSEATVWRIDGTMRLEGRRRTLPASPRRRIEDGERDGIISWHVGRFGLDQPDPRIAYYVLPEYWPRWTRVRSDGRGNIWLRSGASARPELGETWLRWSIETDTLLEVRFPPRTEILQFGGRHAVGVRRDDLGIEYVQLYEIRER